MGLDRLKQRFTEADPRFGPVPFWWWSAEEVTAERVRWHLQKFREGGLRNIGIINIAPTGPQYGSVSDNPAYFSEDWWAMFEVALREAERLGMYLWFYDQIGFSGSNFPARIVAEEPDYGGYNLRRVAKGEAVPEDGKVLLEAEDYTYFEVRQGFNWLDPRATAILLDKVHGEFERRFPNDLGKTIAGTFQDELPPLPLWTGELPQLYKERYGEDLIPHLAALFDQTPGYEEIRRRVYEVATELAEQAFFIPISKWHDKYGMLLGSDQAGPARRVEVHGAQRLYLDYLRTHRWYNSAGCDMDGEIKPHSSMAHLHGGKRVWLEAFHTSGWGGTIEETMHWLVPWFQAGVTLYSPHSIYFSTRGGWWEWAPPDTGWRQPYFEHYPVFADTVSRVCALLNEGQHVCDIAVHYPSHAAVGHMSLSDGKPNQHPMAISNKTPNDRIKHIQDVYNQVTGRWNRRDLEMVGALREARLDFDVVDDSALEKSISEKDKLKIAEERFSVLILCGTTVMDDAARGKVQEWIRDGGWVIAVDPLEGEPVMVGVVVVKTAEEAVALIEKRIPRRIEGSGQTLHRWTEEADVFLLLPDKESIIQMHVPATPQTSMREKAAYRLRTSGTPQLWDPVAGNTHTVSYKRDGEWVEVEVPFTSWPAALVVCPFEEEKAENTVATHTTGSYSRVVPAKVNLEELSGTAPELPSTDWRVEVVPTLDNRYGDFELHGERSERPPVERRMMLVAREEGVAAGEQAGWHQPDFDDSSWTERLWSETEYWQACKGESFDPEQAWPLIYSNTFGDFKFKTWTHGQSSASFPEPRSIGKRRSGLDEDPRCRSSGGTLLDQIREQRGDFRLGERKGNHLAGRP
jgi:hypothetical protein